MSLLIIASSAVYIFYDLTLYINYLLPIDLNEESLEAVTQLLSKSVQVQSSSYHISYLPPSVTESALEVR